MSILKSLLILLSSSFMLSGCFDGGIDGVGNVSSKTTYTLGETFRFDDLDLTFSKEYMSLVIKNRFSEKNNAKVIGLPVTITNKKNEKHFLNSFLYDVYGPNGSALDSAAAFFEDSVDFSKQLLPGASYTKYIYLMYDGDGIYNIIFEIPKQRITLTFDIVYEEPTPEPDPELNKPFTYNNLELTFYDNYEVFTYQPSIFFEGEEIVKIPVTVKNIGTESNYLSSFDTTIYGPNGVEVDDMCSYFASDDSVESAGSLLPNFSYTKSMYFKYVGNGEYKICFGTFEVEKTLKLNVIN